MKKAFGLMLAGLSILCLISGTIAGTWARFLDTETSTGNHLTAGTIDLKTNNADGVTQTLYATILKPNVSVGPSTITLRNAGTTAAATLDIAFSYVESDGSSNTVNMSADSTAAIIEVTTLTYNSSSLLTSISDSNFNGYNDIQDVKNGNLTGRSGLAAAASKDFVVTVKMRDGISNNYQADGIIITMTFTLKQ
jgi:spore coat-associated protein N